MLASQVSKEDASGYCVARYPAKALGYAIRYVHRRQRLIVHNIHAKLDQGVFPVYNFVMQPQWQPLTRGKSQIWLQVTEDSRHFLNPDMFWQPQRTQCLDMTTFMFFCSKCGKLKGILKESCNSFFYEKKCCLDAKFHRNVFG